MAWPGEAAVRAPAVEEAAEAERAGRYTSTIRPSPGRGRWQPRVAPEAAGGGPTWDLPTGGRAEGAEETTEGGRERGGAAVHARSAGLHRAAAPGGRGRGEEAAAARRGHVRGVGVA